MICNLNIQCLIVLVAVSIFIINRTWFVQENAPNNNRTLLVGILSSRSHFGKRNLIRSTWLRSSKSSNELDYKFIIGHLGCNIHPKHRLDEYSCEKFYISREAMKKTASHSVIESQGSSSCGFVYRAFSFKVNRMRVRLSKLGFLFHSSMLQAVSISLLEEITKEPVVSVVINITNMLLENEYVFVEVENYILPSYFKGIVQVDYPLGQKICDLYVKTDDGGGLITYRTAFNENVSAPYSGNEIVAAAMTFEIHNPDELEKHLTSYNHLQSEWKVEIAEEEELLAEEMAEHNDIAMVEVVDVYRNLPAKLINFMAKVSQPFEYFMKTDDDCFINVPAVLHILRQLQHEKLWWGRFRRDWLVNRAGKWEDTDYPSQTYPWFACGSASILSSRLIGWLASNRRYLHPFQGEDVSLGIWLSALNPHYYDDEKWSCDSSCVKDSYVRAQLKDTEMIDANKYSEECGSICSCP